MATIYKEFEFDISEIKNEDFFEELQERIDNSTILYTNEAQEKAKPKIDELLEKMYEIRDWLIAPNSRKF